MAEIQKQLHYKMSGVVHDISLYDSASDVGDDYLSLSVDSSSVYARLGGVNESEASGLRIMKDSTVYAVLKSNRIDLPSGFIAMFDTSCPTGWTRETAFDGKFIRGAAAYGSTGGASTHTHSYTMPDTNSTNHTATELVRVYEALDMPQQTHYHRYSSYSVTSDSAETTPEYITVVFCRKD